MSWQLKTIYQKIMTNTTGQAYDKSHISHTNAPGPVMLFFYSMWLISQHLMSSEKWNIFWSSKVTGLRYVYKENDPVYYDWEIMLQRNSFLDEPAFICLSFLETISESGCKSYYLRLNNGFSLFLPILTVYPFTREYCEIANWHLKFNNPYINCLLHGGKE